MTRGKGERMMFQAMKSNVLGLLYKVDFNIKFSVVIQYVLSAADDE